MREKLKQSQINKPERVCCLQELLKVLQWDFPGGAVVKDPPASAGDTGSSPGPGRSHMPQRN